MRAELAALRDTAEQSNATREREQKREQHERERAARKKERAARKKERGEARAAAKQGNKGKKKSLSRALLTMVAKVALIAAILGVVFGYSPCAVR